MPKGLTPEQLVYDLVGVGEPMISPDGQRIVYSRSQTFRDKLKPVSHLHICDRDCGNDRQLTQAGSRNNGARWSPDGSRIAFVSDAEDDNGLFVMPADGGEPRLITKHRPSVGELTWSPDGTLIAYVAGYDPSNPDETKPGDEDAPPVRVVRRIDYKQENRGFLNDVRQHVWVVDVASGERRRASSELIDHNVPMWSPDGRTLAVKLQLRNGMTAQLGLLDVESGELTRVGPLDGVVGTWAWTPDGTRVLFSGDTSQTWQSDWFLLTVASGEVERLTDDLHCLPDAGFPTVALPAQPVALDEDRFLFHAFRSGVSGLYTFSLSAREVEQVAAFDGQHGGLSVDVAGHYAVQGRAAASGTGEIAVTDLSTGEMRVVVQPNAELLTETPPAPIERLTINRAGLEIEAWLLFPPGFDKAKKYPLVLDIHGGPNAHHGPGFNANQQSLAAAGVLVLFVNPRGSSSYGREFTQQVVKDWAGEDLKDQWAVLDEVVGRGYVDESRLGVYGYSYGGYMTSWIIGHSTRFAAAVIGAPVVDLVSFYGTSDIGHTFGPMQIGGKPWECPDEYRARSPLTELHTATTPALILHGEADDRCPIGQGEQAFMTLHEAGCEVEFVRYPGEAHAMLRTGLHAHRLDYFQRVRDWFTRHLALEA